MGRERSVLAVLLALQGSRVGDSWELQLAITAHAVQLMKLGRLEVYSPPTRQRVLKREARAEERRYSSMVVIMMD